MTQIYEDVVSTLGRPPDQRMTKQLKKLLPFFRRKSHLFSDINDETLVDVIKHCDFLTAPKNTVVVTQGQKGNSFYIILRGTVTVFIQEAFPESQAHDTGDRDIKAILGCQVGKLAEGSTFGEQALINDDCVRTASVLTNEDVDLIIISKDVYNRCLANVVHIEFEEKIDFLNKHPLFSGWSSKWKKSLAIGLLKEVVTYDQVVARQGENADNIFFVIRGGLRVVIEPETYESQLGGFIHESSILFDDEEKAGITSEFFTLANYVSAKSRVAERLRSAPTGSDLDFKVSSADLPEFKINLTPSTVRRKHAEAKANAPKLNVCLLETGHAFGDLEQVLRLNTYHASAISTQETHILRMHRVVFDKLVRKKNPETLKDLAKHLGLLFYKRVARTGLIDKVPLFSYISMRLELLNGQREARRKVKDEDGAVSPWDDLTARLKMSESSGLQNWRRVMRKIPPKAASLPSMSSREKIGGRHASLSERMSLPSRQAHSYARSDSLTQSRHSMQGIYLKLMKMSNPMVTRRDMDVDDDEYNYLLQLKRRLAKRMDEFQPRTIVIEDDTDDRKRGRKGDNKDTELPSVGRRSHGGYCNGFRRQSRKPSQGYLRKKKVEPRMRNVGFALPKC